MGLACFGVFLASVIYSVLTIWKMEKVIASEKVKLTLVQQEYQKYKAAKLIIGKVDIELLNELQGKGIFWTKKLATLAKYLPDNYSITHFTYANNEMRVVGLGQINPQQDQLLILDEYLNRLRSDTLYADLFKKIHLNSAQRGDGGEGGKISFEFSAFTKKWKAQ